jgi:SWI/SNF-related matrix-associated actin-dependent regulator of chromatin subfamily D
VSSHCPPYKRLCNLPPFARFPIKLWLTWERVDQEQTFHPKCYDIPIEIEDPLKSKMATLVASFEGEQGTEIVKLEDKVCELAYFARELQQKRDFLDSFA